MKYTNYSVTAYTDDFYANHVIEHVFTNRIKAWKDTQELFRKMHVTKVVFRNETTDETYGEYIKIKGKGFRGNIPWKK